MLARASSWLLEASLAPPPPVSRGMSTLNAIGPRPVHSGTIRAREVALNGPPRVLRQSRLNRDTLVREREDRLVSFEIGR